MDKTRNQAAEVLRKNSTQRGILAGATHFRDLWARDALYASWGALKTGMIAPVKATLDTLTKYQKDDGQIPLRVGRKSMLAVFLGLPAKTGAVYNNDKNKAPALDPNSLYVITLHEYLKKMGDHTYIDAHMKNIHLAILWLTKQDPEREGLVKEGPYASWDDSLKKHGASIYNNALFYAALKSAAVLTTDPLYKKLAEKTKQKVDERLWKNDHYMAWEARDVMDVAGNLFAIYTGLATDEQAAKILEKLNKLKGARTMPHTGYPEYPARDVYFPLRLIGVYDYHNQGPIWSWLAAFEAIVRQERGDKKNSERIMNELERFIKRSGRIYEIYNEDGTPTRTRFYKSEKDFSWTAGMILLTKDPF